MWFCFFLCVPAPRELRRAIPGDLKNLTQVVLHEATVYIGERLDELVNNDSLILSILCAFFTFNISLFLRISLVEQ